MFANLKSYIRTTRFKTTLWYSSLFLLLEIVIGILVYFYLGNSMYHQLDTSLSRQAESIYNFVQDKKFNLTHFQPDSVYASQEDFVYDLIFDAVILNPRNTFVQVELNNHSIFKTENLRNHSISIQDLESQKVKMATFSDTTISDYPIRAAILNKDQYNIIVAFPLHHISETMESLAEIFIIIAPVFFMFSILGGYVISSKSLSRIDYIIKKTEEITTQNLDEKIEGEEFRDEYGRLVKKMNEMILRIKNSIQYMNQFSISASHELKTPLTILRGEIEIALRSPKTPVEYRQILFSNYEETLRLISIVDKLFFISKFDHSLIKLNKEKVMLNKFLNDVVSPLKNLGKEKNICLSLELSQDIPLEIDIELIRSAVTNLIENAVKYGYENHTVIVKTKLLHNNKVKISVINKGEGILPEVLPKIFDRFYRIESSRNRTTGGVGLGLSVVKSIINWHNGEVNVISEPGKETEFYIILNSIE
jgi:heavy metal sensor kinase